MQKVACIKSSEGGSFDSYQNVLQKHNYKTILVSAISFMYKNLFELKAYLNQPENYNGIIFTSPRSVSAIELALNGEKLNEKWKSKLNYCVGQSTWHDIKTKLNIDARGQDCGSASNLSAFIIKNFKCEEKSDLPFLFPCSSIKRETLIENLTLQGIALETIDVYDTVPHPNLESSLSMVIPDKEVKYLVFFSPSGVNACMEILKNHHWSFKTKKLIAIGETTKKSLIDTGNICYGTAKTPSPEGLLECLNDIS